MSTSSLPALAGVEAHSPSNAGAEAAKRKSIARRRVAPDRPVGKFLGGVLAALGLIYALGVILAGPEFISWYWAPNAPEFNALAGGFLLAAGILVLVWRFSIRLMLAMFLLAGAIGVVGQVVGRRTPLVHRTHLISHNNKSLLALINEGIVGTLVERGVFDAEHPPMRASIDSWNRLHLVVYPHADPRVLRMPQAIETFVEKMEGVDSKGQPLERPRERNMILPAYYWTSVVDVRTDMQDAAEYLHGTLSKRFGEEHARAILERCAGMVRSRELRAAFLLQAGKAEPLEPPHDPPANPVLPAIPPAPVETEPAEALEEIEPQDPNILELP